ncbi:MAG: PKD domain-containing protein [Armatimonadetes bacterium]|nr:PKD domain-containing protein [Armatimonadota bacterium]
MRFFRVLLIVAIALCAVAAHAEPDVYIYRGSPVSQDGLTLGGWGSGKAAESKERLLNGSNSIKITTQGYYSGGRIDFVQPVTLFTDGPEKDRYIQFALFFEDVKTVDPAADSGYDLDTDPYSVPKAGKVRFVFVSDSGEMISKEEPTNQLDPDDNWVRVVVPLCKLKLPEGTKEFRLSRLMIFSDMSCTMHLGEIKLMTDNKPIKVDSLGSRTLGVQDRVYFIAETDGGVSSLKYSWDFDNSNGIQAESTGRMASYTYTRGGDFTITLTVSDHDGVKAPVTVTGTVSVND